MNDILKTEGFQEIYKEYLKSGNKEKKDTGSLEEFTKFNLNTILITGVFCSVVSLAIAFTPLKSTGIANYPGWLWSSLPIVIIYNSICILNSDIGKYPGVFKLYKRLSNKKPTKKANIVSEEFLTYMKTTGVSKYQEIIDQTNTILSKIENGRKVLVGILEQSPADDIKEVSTQLIADLVTKKEILEAQKSSAKEGLKEFQVLCGTIDKELTQQNTVKNLSEALQLTNTADDFIQMNQQRIERLANGTLRAKEALNAFAEVKKEQSLESFAILELKA